jgi:hypothetical protein
MMSLLQPIGTTTHLSGNGMASSREQLGDASSLETSFCETESSSQTCTTRSAVSLILEKLGGLQTYRNLHNDRIIFVFNKRIFSRRPGLQ